MRMEELSEHRYIKSTDTVEAYLLQLVEDYFKHTSVASPASREYVIERAVKRMKDELTFEGVGVLSITLPGDTEPRTGAVRISLEELGGEPLIAPKLSAFNVNFGIEQNTACEGNDPRLSDKRFPLQHKHQISEVIGLEGILSTLEEQVKKATGISHTHKNQSVLNMLTYSGNKTVIDLTILDTLEPKINQIVENIKNDINTYKSQIDAKLSQVNTKITEVQQAVASLQQFIIDKNKEYYNAAKQYTDEAITTSEEKIYKEFEKYVKNADIQPLVDIANRITTLVGTQTIDLMSRIQIGSTDKKYEFSEPIETRLLDEIQDRNQLFNECQFELYMTYYFNGKQVYEQIPFVSIINNKIDGILQVSIDSTNKTVNVTFDTDTGTVPIEFSDAVIHLNIYSKQDVSI